MHYLKSVAIIIATLAAVSVGAPTRCSLDTVVLPPGAEALPGPEGRVPIRVLLGVGFQNYTCEESSADVKPVANGAMAKLYDASCWAENAEAFERFTTMAYGFNDNIWSYIVNMFSALGRANIEVGSHYFSDPKTAKFDFEKTAPGDYFVGAKKNNTTSPKGSENVDWLRLDSTDTSRGYTVAFRVVTQGGVPPANCADQEERDVQVKYTAQYWLY